MIAYIDASVLLRVVLGQPDAWTSWREVDIGISSALTEVECFRTLDRVRLRAGLSAEDIARCYESTHRYLQGLDIVEATAPVLRRAAKPLPVHLGTLDAIHLATATLWQEQRGADLVLATHGAALSAAARASGLRVGGA